MKFALSSTIGALLLVCASSLARADAKSPAAWRAEFAKLELGTSRVETETQIAAIRQVKTTYNLWAMDTSAVVAYRLDAESILLATYTPGTPAAHVTAGQGHPPVDGALVGFDILPLR